MVPIGFYREIADGWDEHSIKSQNGARSVFDFLRPMLDGPSASPSAKTDRDVRDQHLRSPTSSGVAGWIGDWNSLARSAYS